MTHGYFNDVYIKPWCRLSPYAVGLAVGYVLYEIYQRSNTLSWDHLMPQRMIYSRSHYVKQIITWTLALVVLSLCIFGTFGDYSGHPLTRQNRIAFLTLSRLGWAIGLCMIIIACFAGHGGEISKNHSFESSFLFVNIGLANRLLSLPCFYMLSKLTYGAFLWHTLVIFVNYLGREQPTHYTVANIVSEFLRFIKKNNFFRLLFLVFQFRLLHDLLVSALIFHISSR